MKRRRSYSKPALLLASAHTSFAVSILASNSALRRRKRLQLDSNRGTYAATDAISLRTFALSRPNRLASTVEPHVGHFPSCHSVSFFSTTRCIAANEIRLRSSLLSQIDSVAFSCLYFGRSEEHTS